jgi:hypothetical protein
LICSITGMSWSVPMTSSVPCAANKEIAMSDLAETATW